MKLHLYTIFDSAADAFLPPFHERADASAIRAFQQALQNPQHQFAKHPADYTLFRTATFDDSSGFVEPFAAMANLGNGLALSKPPE